MGLLLSKQFSVIHETYLVQALTDFLNVQLYPIKMYLGRDSIYSRALMTLVPKCLRGLPQTMLWLINIHASAMPKIIFGLHTDYTTYIQLYYVDDYLRSQNQWVAI